MNKILFMVLVSSTALTSLCYADLPVQIENAQRAIDKSYDQIEEAKEKLEKKNNE